MVSHNTTDIQVVMEVFQQLIVKEFMFCVSQGISSIKRLTPFQWVGRHVTLRLRWKCLPT